MMVNALPITCVALLAAKALPITCSISLALVCSDTAKMRRYPLRISYRVRTLRRPEAYAKQQANIALAEYFGE